jgi:AcrR family transcriptional regulator
MRLPADQRRLQLLEVARNRFAVQGFHATSMDEIAEAAGVTKPVLYQHFPSKRALYVELLDDTGRELLAKLDEATSRAMTGRERVEEGFRAYFNFAVSNRAAFRLLLGTSLRSDAEFASIVEEILAAVAETISTLIEIPASDEQRLVLATALVGMAEGVSRRTITEPNVALDPDELARWISELAWFGLRGVRADRRAVAPTDS